jgi:hypothetical protein
VLLDAVPDHAAAAVFAGERQRMIAHSNEFEGADGAIHRHLERLVMILSAGFASAMARSLGCR